MKNEYQKFFGHLVLNAAKNKLHENMSKYQIGAKPGHRAQEHLFTIKSAISLNTPYNKPLILSTYDVSKYFDRESLQDCLNELYKCNIKGKVYRLMYKLNENTQIQVNTPVGMSEKEDVGESVGQGTVE